MKRRTDKEWREIITDWSSSGLSMRSYCRGKNISYWSFRENKRKQESAGPPVSIENSLVRISPQRPSAQQVSSPITVVLTDKIKLEISDSFNPNTLREVIDALGYLE